MEESKRILLYGNSLILGSIGVNLRRYPQFEVMTVPIPLQDSITLDGVKCDVLLFDTEAPHIEAPFFLLKNHPNLVMIGISPGTNLVRVWNSQQLREMSMQDLLELIKKGAMGSTDAPIEPLLDENPKIRKGEARGF